MLLRVQLVHSPKINELFEALISGEKNISKIESRELINSPLDNSPLKIKTNSVKRIRYRHYDFSTILPPKDGLPGSDVNNK